MTRFVFLLILACAFASASAAQTSEVFGTVTDSTDVGLPGATIVLLHPSDSTLVSFGTSRSDGSFRMPRLALGAYMLQITFVGFLPSTSQIDVGPEPLDLGRLPLEADLDGLDPLVVTAERVAMVVKADTLEFNADAFGAPEGSSVEDLLRRLPGVEIERDGSIKAQGETVERVFVDGKEFFGDDPTIATRNLPADAVDRVQIYDKASETAEFTGVDDGQDFRAINLALKDDRRTGMFGNLAGGLGGSSVPPEAGLRDGVRFDGSASINRFNPSTQLSLIGNANNVNRQDFSIEDYIQFLGGLSALTQGSGSLRLNASELGIPLGESASEGFATTFSGGLNANHQFSESTSLESNYFGTTIGTQRTQEARSRQVLGQDLASETESTSESTSNTQAHRLNLWLKHEFRPGQDLGLRTNVRTIGTDLASLGFRETIGPAGRLESDRLTTTSTSGDKPGANATLTFRQRLPGARSIVASLRSSVGASSDVRDLVSADRVGVGAPMLEPRDQLRTMNGRTSTHAATALFTQSLSRRQAVQISASHTIETEKEDIEVLDRLSGMPVLDLAQSTAFSRTTHTSRGGVTYRNNGESHQLSLGVDLQRTRLDGNASAGAAVSRRSLHVLPSASLAYTFPRDQQLTLRYDASVLEPTIRQLQAVPDTRDPLRIYAGNPDLGPEIRHNLSARFMHFDTFALTTLVGVLRATYSPTAISTSRTIDDGFRQRLSPINTSGALSLYGDGSYNTPIRRLGSRIGLSLSTQYRRQVELLNEAENVSGLWRTTLDVSIENQKKTWLDVRAGGRVTVNASAYSLSPEFDQTYVSRTLYTEGSAEIGASWFVSSSLDLEFFPADIFGSTQRVPLWSAEVTRRLNGRVRVQLVGGDLLDQGIGVRFATSGALIQEQRTQSLGRHVLLKLVYNLSEVTR